MGKTGGSGNFGFLAIHSPVLARLGEVAEKLLPLDPGSCVTRLRLLAESITQEVAAQLGMAPQPQQTQLEMLRVISRQLDLDPQIQQMFHLLRKRGNEAAHDVRAQIGFREAVEALRVAREIGLWYYRTFGNPSGGFRPGPFVLPDDPSQKLLELQNTIDALQDQLAHAQARQSDQDHLDELRRQELEQERTLAARATEERQIYEALAEEATQVVDQLQKELARTRAQVAQAGVPDSARVRQWGQRSSQAAALVEMDERTARRLIDQQLRDAGWEADTGELTHARGIRPQRGRNLAIAEWPMGRERADYVLFAGLTPVAVVEAKRPRERIAGRIDQAERYARGFQPGDGMEPAWLQHTRGGSGTAASVAGRKGWPDGQRGYFRIPFVFSCNGRPYLKQLKDHSGIWFRDVRQPSNTPRALANFHSPGGLMDLLQRDAQQAQQRLATESFEYLKLRDYQIKAIQAVETALAKGGRQALVAMATGTGKTSTAIGLMYRQLKAERFRRILFLVDRRSLGQQTLDSFDAMVLENNLAFSRIYEVAKMDVAQAEAQTRVQVSTVQAMARRLFDSDDPPPVDAYDCIIVDEAHRGYTLDQEMTEGELVLRDQAQYLSTYRRVLDHFDAVRIGLTATPARHTSDIFGRPLFTYSYREAVADLWLVDHEPPIRYVTQLSKNGIHFDKGDEVERLDVLTGALDVAQLEDEQHFDVEGFNRRVISENFDRVICEALVQELDPNGDEKTLIFCVNDLHADRVVRLLREAFSVQLGETFNQASIQKITGKTDRVDDAIRRYKNEQFPNIAVTVDLLTTGIDVPKICNLVFMRRVKSRILYEQMLGRATRLCEDIGKTVFRIHDAVDLYATLESVNTMKPVVKDPKVSLEQLLLELQNPAVLTTPGSEPGLSHADEVLEQVGQKIAHRMRKVVYILENGSQREQEELKMRLDQLESDWGVPPVTLAGHIRQLHRQKGAKAAIRFVHGLPRLGGQVENLALLTRGDSGKALISEHDDVLRERTQSWGPYARPEDYLGAFGDFVRRMANESMALSVVVNRPRDLTREHLKQVRLLLDQGGYSEANLKSAWLRRSNQDIAAGIVAYIRQAALGEPLVPFEQRVARAMQRIYSMHSWTNPQRKWLDRLSRELVRETVLDRQSVNECFASLGGYAGLNKQLGNRLSEVLNALADGLWDTAA